MNTALRCVRIVVWLDGAARHVDESELGSGPVRKAIGRGSPVWVQLALPRLSSVEQAWFEGSVDPWGEIEAVEPDWSAVEPLLDRVGLGSSALGADERRLLRRMPHLYGRGIARVAREVWGRQSSLGTDMRFFPTVGFRPVDGSDMPCFWTVRMTVGVIRNAVITVRLPDLRWNGDSEQFEYAPGDGIAVPERFFPDAEDVTADDLADAIGVQQATTARAVSTRIRTHVTKIEREWRQEVERGARSSREKNLGDARRVIEMTDSLLQLDRQLSRLLRRFELDRSQTRSTSRDIALRYRFALDELRSLEADCRLASQTIDHAIKSAEQADRERFQFVAGVLGSAILVPTLVASIYGANVALPAKDSWRGFIALLLFINAFALIGLFAISKVLPRGEWHPRRPWLARLPVRSGLIVAAVASLAGGVLAVA